MRIVLILIFFVLGLKPLLSWDQTQGASAGRPPVPRIHLQIYRAFKSDTCNSGYLAVENQIIVYTLERPDLANLDDLSSIPEGVYPAHLRYDNKDKWRIQLDDVPDRTNVQIHMGNNVSESAGCILVGMGLGDCSLTNSSLAYDRLKKTFYHTLNEKNIPKMVDIQVEVDDISPQTQIEMGRVYPEILQTQDVSHLIKMMDTDDDAQRLRIVSALGMLGSDAEPAVPHILPLLFEKDCLDKSNIYMALVQIGLDDPSERDRVIQEALKDFERKEFSVKNEFLRGTAADVLGKLSQTKETARLLLKQLKTETNPIVKGKILESLGEMGQLNPEILPLLIRMAGHQNESERGSALIGLGYMGPQARPALGVVENNLNHSDRFIREYAQIAFDRIEDSPDHSIYTP